MDKRTYYEILQASLFAFDGYAEEKVVNEYGLNPKLVKIGFQLCNYLKSKEVITEGKETNEP